MWRTLHTHSCTHAGGWYSRDPSNSPTPWAPADRSTGLGFLSARKENPQTFAGFLILAPGLGTISNQGPVLALQLFNILAVGLEEKGVQCGKEILKPWGS